MTAALRGSAIHQPDAPLRSIAWPIFLGLMITIILGGCAPTAKSRPHQEAFLTPIDSLRPAALSVDSRLKVVATTNIVADVVRNVGGPDIELTPLIPLGADPHAYQPTPGDLRALTQADLILINGLGLEAQLAPTLSTLSQDGIPVVSLSEGLETRAWSPQTDEQHAPDESHDAGLDPHVWLDPLQVARWAENAQQALSRRDPARAETYRQRAQEYRDTLWELHEWILKRIEEIPTARRKLVADHLALGYFAHRYGFEMVGALIPAYSTAAEPSSQALATLQEVIREQGVAAIFVERSLNPRLAARLAQDVGVPVVPLYIGTLSPPSGEAPSYIAMMQYNVDAIVRALAQ